MEKRYGSHVRVREYAIMARGRDILLLNEII